VGRRTVRLEPASLPGSGRSRQTPAAQGPQRGLNPTFCSVAPRTPRPLAEALQFLGGLGRHAQCAAAFATATRAKACWLFLFTKNILAGELIKVFNHGNHTRDFTYVDDIVEGVIRASDQIAAPDPAWDPANPDPATSNAPYRVFNIGNDAPVTLIQHIEARKSARQEVGPRAAPAAARRRAGHPRRHFDARSRRQLPPPHHRRRRCPPLRRLVPGLLRGLTAALRSRPRPQPAD
jgi:hypothetical protein